MLNKEFIIVPYWAYECVQRRGGKVDDLVDFEKVRSWFSVRDLALLLAAQDQQNWVTVIGGEKKNAPYSWFSLADQWQKSAQSDESKAMLNSTVLPIAQMPSSAEAVAARLFAGSQKREHDEKPFIIYDIPPALAAVVIYPGHFGQANSGDLQFRALVGILKVLYAYSTTHNEVSSTLWYRQYLSGLSTKQMVA